MSAAVLLDAFPLPATICTYSGRAVQPLNARPSDICIEDIAHSLSLQCRFAGHTRRFYSIAEHSIYVSRLVPAEQRLAALLHDASEAYLMDLVRPLKRMPEFAFYRRAEEQLMAVIGEALGFDPSPTAEIQDADAKMLEIEMGELLSQADGKDEHERVVGRFQGKIGNVEVRFLNEFEDLTGVRRGRGEILRGTIAR